MKKKLLSALLGGGALAIAGLAAMPVLATGADAGDAAPVSTSDTAGDVTSDPVIETPQITPAEELQATFSPAPSTSEQHEIDLKGAITVSFPADQEVTLTTDAALKPHFGQELPLPELESAPEAVKGETNVWSINLGSRVTAEGDYFLTLPAGMWTIAGEPSREMTIYYHLEGRVDVVPDTESGIYGANYTYTDEHGNVFGYHIDFDWNGEYRYEYDEDGNQIGGKDVYIYNVRNGYLCGVKTAESSIKLPGHVYITALPADSEYTYGEEQEIGNRDYSVTSAEFRHDLLNEGVETSFPASGVAGAEELKDVYVPASVGSVRWTGKFDTPTTNFHFSTSECPELSFDEYANGKVFIYALDDYYYDYKEQVKGKYNFTVFVRSESPASPVYINVSEPGTLAAELSASGAVLEEVRYVIVTGTPDETDLRFFRRLPNLEILDLGQTIGLTTVTGLNGLEYLHTVVLPETGEMTSIGPEAFKNCISLREINIPNGVTEIKYSAFYHVESLKKIHFPITLETIESNAFEGTGITEANLENVKDFGYASFRDTDLVKIELNSAITISEYAFSDNVSLIDIKFGDNLTSIDRESFRACSVSEIHLPNKLKDLGNYAFEYCYSLKLIEFGNNNNIHLNGDYIIDQRNPYDVIVNYLFPLETSGISEYSRKVATVHVPALTVNDFLLSDAWVGAKIVAMDKDLEAVEVNRTFKLTSEKGIADKATLSLLASLGNYSNNGQLTVKRKTDLNLGKFDINGYRVRGDYWTGNRWEQFTGYSGATLIPQSTMTSDEVAVNINMQKDRWHFLTLPFDVNVDDIEVEDEALWVVRKYSGEDRANLTGNTWQNVQAGETLKAGEGYIFHCTKEDGDCVSFTFRPVADGNALFNMGNVETELAEYPSEFLHNASWNLVGNTYPAYLTLRAVDFDAPITVWDGNTYTVYSPIDDDYAFSPFQAFFVQRQDIEGGDHLTLDPRGRAHSEADALAIEIEDEVEETPAEDEEPAVAARAAKRAARAAEPRSIFNLTLSSEKGADRARIVVNPLASEAYEPNRDASKFMSSEAAVPQIFVVNDGQRMAIDERPLAEGIYSLGARFGHSGEYCISLDSRQAEGYVAMLTDNLTGVTVDITATPYAFVADAGASDDRFTLRLMPGIITGIEDVEAEGISISLDGNLLSISSPAEVEISVIAADGKIVAIDRSAAFSMSLDKGAYIVKAGDAVRKLIAE